VRPIVQSTARLGFALPRANSFAPEWASGRPLYRQLVDWLRSDIARRAVGDRIESEPQLAERFGVSRFTVTRAIEILVDEGLIRRRQGLGSFVAPPPLQRAPSYLSSFTEAVEAQGQRASHRLLHSGPVAWRRDLPYPEGVALVGMDRLRLVEGEPTAIHRSVIDAGLADRIGLTRSVARTPRFSLYRLLDQAGLKIERGVETLRARLATPEEARLLEIGDEPVVMAVRRETRERDGALLDVVDAVYDARRYSYQAEIRRDTTATLASSHPRKAMEKDHESKSNIGRHFGPRLGPWTGRDGERG
jgi:GntR family transcriptional regulator